MWQSKDIEFISGLLKERQKNISEITLSHIYDNYKKTGRIDAALWEQGSKVPLHHYFDSDVAKLIEAAAGSLQKYPDPEMHDKIQRVIDNLLTIQWPDGYLNSYYSNKAPNERWQDIRNKHELYCAGHLIEAAIAWHYYCGDERFLGGMKKYADLICGKFGDAPGQLKTFPGHPEIELALYRLFKYTGEQRYLDTVNFFIKQRGTNNEYYYREAEQLGIGPEQVEKSLKNIILDKPLKEQNLATGHAVRACYLYCAMADLARETADEKLFSQCKSIWKSIIEKRMNITGGIGSDWHTEGFGDAYELPEEYYYETCAQIALFMFSWRMLKSEKDGKYADVMEKTLYNSILSGISASGKAFFYSNPLIGINNKSTMNKHGSDQWGTSRQENFSCSCCPPNISRLLADINSYMFEICGRDIWLHLFGGYNIMLKGENGYFNIQVNTDYPWNGLMKINIDGESSEKFKIFLRRPGWSKKTTVKIDDNPIDVHAKDGYFCLEQTWKNNLIEIEFDMGVKLITGHPEMRQLVGKAAVTRGPIVYCAEEIDNAANLFSYKVVNGNGFVAENKSIAGIEAVTLKTCAANYPYGNDYPLYQNIDDMNCVDAELNLIPYFLWNNRDTQKMLVWFNYENCIKAQSKCVETSKYKKTTPVNTEEKCHEKDKIHTH